MAILGKTNNQSRLTYCGYAGHIWETSVEREEKLRVSAVETARMWGGFDLNAFINAKRETDQAVSKLANEINKSSASDPLTILAAGPMQVVGMAIAESDVSKRQFVTVISHSGWNDLHATEHGGYSYQVLGNMGVKLDHIQDQNEGLNEPYEEYHWLRDSSDPKLQWLWERAIAAGKSTFDESDAGMTYYLLTGDENATPEKLRDLLE
jgi:hypothetical protein